MDNELIQNFARFLSSGGWMFYILTFIFTFISSVVGAYFGSYGNKRGELRAIQDDFEKIKVQLQETTRITSKIQSEISRGEWVNQQRWELRRDLYLELLKNLIEAKFTLSSIAEAEWDSFDGDSEDREKFIDEMLERNKRASQEIRSLMQYKGVLFLSDEALKTLNTYLNAENIRIENLRKTEDKHGDVAAEATSWNIYLDSELSAAYNAYDEIVKTAKADLQIGQIIT